MSKKTQEGKKDALPKKDSQVEVSDKGGDTKSKSLQFAVNKPVVDKPKGNSIGTKDKFKCGECGLVFTSKPDLLEHCRIHAADKPFECDICHKFFKERNNLSVHRKLHVQDGLHRCNMCSKGFAHKSDLDIHMQSHPKRSNNNAAVPKKANSLSNSKTLDKVKSSKEKDNVVEKAPVKPASFSLALGGEPDSLVLTKKKEHSSSNKTTESSNETPPKSKSNSSSAKVVDKVKPTPKSNSDVKQQVASEKIATSLKVKEMAVVSEADKLAGVCSCNECPECVTRFLASFDS